MTVRLMFNNLLSSAIEAGKEVEGNLFDLFREDVDEILEDGTLEELLEFPEDAEYLLELISNDKTYTE
jgi:hypothetical protein